MFMVNVGKYIIHCASGYGRKCISPVSHGIFSTQRKLFFSQLPGTEAPGSHEYDKFLPKVGRDGHWTSGGLYEI